MRLFVSISLCILNIGHVTLGGWLWSKPSPPPAVHVTRSNLQGCYVDQWARTLNGGMTKSNSMTVRKCADRCRRENKRFYGLEVGVECFTGNEIRKNNKRSEGECKMACKGNRKEACGNHWRVLIYRNPHYRSILVKSGYQGCYQDQRSRTLNQKMQSSSRMTVYMCRNFCTKHNTQYYGVENGNECWCGDSLRRRVRKRDDDCLKQCRGNRNQGCGGPWRLAVYRNYNYKRTAVQTSGLVGCYRDQRDRVLRGSRTSSSSMTLARCRSRAQREKKKYFGMQVGHECFVGDFMKYQNKRPTSECLMPCKGNRAEGCGGNWRIVIYKNHRYRSNLVKTGFVGCYQDQWARTLKRKKTSSSRMTFEKCRSICSDKKVNAQYFGMENGNECHCGDHLTRKVKKNEGECTKKCNGNHGQGCGGPWRIVIYRNSNYKKTRVLSGGLVGCYKDQRDRVLKGSRTSSSSMTLARCRSRAQRENKKYFGMQVGHECFVGDFMKHHNKRRTSECLMPCRGNHAEGCGGHWRIVIYKNHKYRSNLVKTGFVGCYQDQWARTLKRKKTSSSRMTFEKCRSICTNKKVNSKYFGMENGNECHCGDHLTKKVKKNDGECTKKCNGNGRQGCGGPWRIIVYRNSNYKKTSVLKGGLVGCYKDQRDRVLRGARTTSSSMDLAKCRSRAQKENAKYFGMQVGHECFVGDFMKFKNKRPTSECLMPCKGNYAQGCGGHWRIVIYRNHKFKSNLVKTGFVGCYQDQWARTLNRKKTTSRHMTFEKCRSICSHKKVNSAYFGMENGNECFCGNTLTRKVLKVEGECTKKCKGNHKQGCGGPWRIAVYRNAKYKKTRVSSGALLGCFIDQRDRVLRNGRTTSNSMTPDMCKKRCIKENKKFYGLEAGRECFCGDFLKRHKRRPQKECMDPCKGDRSHACGSGWRILIYKNTAYKSNIVKKDLLGCFKDQHARTLNIVKSHSSKMTIRKCQAICEKKNAKYYGLEVGAECHCGNFLSTYNKKDLSECKMPCRGNKKQGCGGRWRVLIYKNRKYKTNIVQKEYVGCYKDQRSRTLKGKKTVSSKMTVSMCRKTCITLKMKFYGLEATHECFCGNKLTKKVVKSDGECTHSCKGDKSQACGGPWRLAVYENPAFKHTAIVKKEYTGCYKDHTFRILKGKRTSSYSMTVDKCRKTCTDHKFKYYGVQATRQCFCGNKLTKINKKKDSECMDPCRGNREQACGGNWRMAVYRNPKHKPTAIVQKALLGCFIDQRDRVLRNGRTTSNSMTPDMCKKRCIKENKKFYGLEAGRECFCGDFLKRHKRRPQKECMDPCKGDRSQACGSGWRILIYKNTAYKSNIVKKDLLGCFKDQHARTLNIVKSHSSKMTIRKCQAICEKKNAKYYGLEVGTECHCGNFLSTYKKKDLSECKMPCRGNKKQGCGGRWRVLIYKNRKYKTNIVQKEYVGCYKDQRSRTLKGKKTVSSKMTVSMCRKTCITLKMKFYGLEATHECFCGNKLTKKVVKSDGECTHSCKGDKSQACGGPWRLAVYENPAFKHTAIVKKEYTGCYKDHAFRILKGKRTSSYSMTVDKCRKTCTDHKFKYYGVQATRQCFCGNKLTKINKKKDSECMDPCRGNREQACGGNWRMAVYRNPKHKPTAIVQKDYVGCHVDQRKRTFSKKKTISKTMTVGKCQKICEKADTKYYGLEYGKECFCGNKLSKKKPDSDCMKPCTGDREQACGGRWRLAVYKNTKFGPPPKPPTICKDKKGVVQCSSSGGKRSVCIVPKAELVLNVDPKSSSSDCVAGKTYGRHGDEIWVSGKCGGKFDVCYREVVEEEVSNDCVKTADGSDYAGTWNKTKSGKSCQAWSSQKPHKHGFTHLPQNSCRNPDGEPHAWCYTTDPKTRWEFCDLPQCKTPTAGEAEECLTQPKGQNYEGTKSVTKSGIKCQAWSVQTPHSHSFSKSLGNQVNYCRNPDGEPKPWCYTSDKAKRWEFCDIPECATCDVELEKGPDCKVIYKVSGSCHYESHYRNQCKYAVTLSKDGTGNLQADVKYGKTKFSLVKGKGVNKCAYFKIIGDYVVIEDTLSHGC